MLIVESGRSRLAAEETRAHGTNSRSTFCCPEHLPHGSDKSDKLSRIGELSKFARGKQWLSVARRVRLRIMSQAASRCVWPPCSIREYEVVATMADPPAICQRTAQALCK